ncbi:hypothetical protein ON010_g18068 [Phytophthora cinnamomi]|nr:hypothetical protein ON010_g18068 [Phytophthora cinnamomi]
MTTPLSSGVHLWRTQPATKQSVEQPEKRTKRSRDAPKEAKERLGKPHENRAAKDTAVSKKSSPVESSGSSSSSSSSSENERSSESSSSSSSESEEDVGQRDQKHATRAASVRTQRARQKETASAGKAASNGIGSRTNAPETATKEPRRRRRRLRQRNGRRQRNGEVVAETSANQTLPFSNSNGTLQKQEGIPEQSNETSGTRIGSNNAGLRGYPRAKAHVLFDEVTGDQVEVQHNDRMSNENRTIRRPGEPELAKYGPSYPGSQQSLRSNQVRSSASLNVLNGEEDNSTSAPKRKGKGKYEEKWKRPYEIVATVLDGNAEKSNTSAEGLTTALNSYPAATAGSCGFMPADILAFKTLTLCLETWQPVVSDWQCGQVQSVDASGNSIELLKWTLETNGDSVNFLEGPSREQCSIQISEISELRFLSGPSYATLQQ